MIVVDRFAFTRLARTLRQQSAVHGIVGSHSLFREAAASALGFRDVNAVTATFRFADPLREGDPEDADSRLGREARVWLPDAA